MTNNIEQFFNADLTERIHCVYTEKIPKDMIASEVNENGWYEWNITTYLKEKKN
ncbi:MULTISPECIES: hypothetical protein [unclassified Sphingobacterium]|uniref:hypothetical protein n=1 Tax=unclassified Sphingobacterium TaxID=2609468 RepID=UPI00295375B6|nr:hypothetical protein [Sphingobacterium sp. UGAL515B_05]WON93574.1 hypothetical protein OK025_20285 [Sphingobacterium sp. UGAL515B_05]